MTDPELPNLSEADVQHFQALSSKIEAKLEQRENIYRAWYESAKSQVLASANGTAPSPQKIDLAIAVSVLAESNDPRDVGHVLSQSDLAREWKATLPETEYRPKLVAYIQETYNLADGERQRQEQQKNAGLER